jgi:hypothetical protein
MKKLFVFLCIGVLFLAVVVWAVDQFADYNMKENPHGLRVWTPNNYPKWINGTVKDTTTQIDIHDFVYFATWISRSTDGNCDSCRLHIYFQQSMDGSYWTTADTIALAGKTTDTTSYLKQWSTIEGCPYARIINYAGGVANCSTYVREKHGFQQ